MKKFLMLYMAILMCFSIVGCSSNNNITSKKNPNEIIQDSDFENLGWTYGIMWKYSFSDMEACVIFNDNDKGLDSAQYYLSKPLLATEISSIQVCPDVSTPSQFLYIIFEDGEFKIDEEDLEKFKDKGRPEAKESYDKKLKDLGITTQDIGEFTMQYFNDTVRQQLIKEAEEKAQKVKQDLENLGFTCEESSNRTIISSDKEAYKIVIATNNCMIVDASMDLSGGVKNGYMYNASLGTCGYIKNDETTFVYEYSSNTLLQGSLSLEEYAEVQEVKEWYDSLLKQLSIETSVLENL